MSTVRRLVRALGLQAFAGLAAWTIVATVAAMARLHGSFAAIGLVFGGLLGWRLADRP
jgi:hypothetical protein